MVLNHVGRGLTTPPEPAPQGQIALDRRPLEGGVGLAIARHPNFPPAVELPAREAFRSSQIVQIVFLGNHRITLLFDGLMIS